MKRIFLSLLFSLAFCHEAFAVTAVDRYVDTDCANNGDGTGSGCAASGGAAGAYKTLGQGLVDINADYASFTVSDIQMTVHCKGATADTGGPGPDDVDTGGLGTNATHQLIIQVDQANRHAGSYNTGKYRIETTSYYALVKIQDDFVVLDGLQGKQNGTTGRQNGIWLTNTAAAGHIIIKNCIFYTVGTGASEGFGVQDEHSGTAQIIEMRNNIFYDWRVNFAAVTNLNDIIAMYNNTAMDAAVVGLQYSRGGTGAAIYVKNNIVNGSNTNYAVYSSTASVTTATNISEDTTSPDTALRSKAVSFVNEGSNDFHLNSGDTAAKDAGTDLSGDTYGFTTDIDGATRSGTWDIGADEVSSAGQNLLLVGTGED